MLLKNGRIISPNENFDEIADLRIENGKIVEIATSIAEKFREEVINCKDFVVAPGFVELHCHLREPGFEQKETIESGINSAIAGGFTTIFPMANTKPVVDNIETLDFVNKKAKKHSEIEFHQICAITKNLEGKELVNFNELAEKGVIAFSDDGHGVENLELLEKALIRAKSLNSLIILHSEDKKLAQNGVITESDYAKKLGLRGIPTEAESSAIENELKIIEKTGAKVHFAHVSTSKSIELIRNAKKTGLNITCETAPHYFSLALGDIKDFRAIYKVNPPIRTQSDVEAVIKAICDGTIDAIATDHAPHTEVEKMSDIYTAPMGIVGFETAFGLTMTNLVEKGYVTLSKAIALLSSNPAKITKLKNQGSIKIGNFANLCVFNPTEKYKVDATKFNSKCKISPFHNTILTGVVKYTIINGKVIQNGNNE